MSWLDARTILAVQPHYDDNDIGCAGTLAQFANAGGEVVYVTVTDDLAGVLDHQIDDDTARACLLAEQHEAGALLGVSRFVDLDWPDAAGLDHTVLRNQVIDLIREIRPDLVLTVDPWLAHEAHRDHVITGQAVCEAMILSGLPRVRRATGGTAAYGAPRIGLYYTKEPTDVVDTSAVQEVRHAVLDCYRSQFGLDDLAGLHRVVDRYERSIAPPGATHGEQLKVLGAGALHVGL